MEMWFVHHISNLVKRFLASLTGGCAHVDSFWGQDLANINMVRLIDSLFNMPGVKNQDQVLVADV